jgi:dTDP-glucose 4,6-dehydratase
VGNYCRGILAVLERGKIGEVYNIGALDIKENLRMAQRLLSVIGKPETLITFVKDRSGNDRRCALKCNKIKSELDWEPAISLEEGLR